RLQQSLIHRHGLATCAGLLDSDVVRRRVAREVPRHYAKQQQRREGPPQQIFHAPHLLEHTETGAASRRAIDQAPVLQFNFVTVASTSNFFMVTGPSIETI